MTINIDHLTDQEHELYLELIKAREENDYLQEQIALLKQELLKVGK